ncbi:hypothetical protein L7F22_015447 [Adiantum nelumboides]|nr:hypothetical protein [Adiantum nelumboides]
MCDALWGKTPKCVGIAGAFDSDGNKPISSTANGPFDLDGLKGVSTSKNPQGPQVDSIDLDGVFGKKIKQPKWSSLGTVAKTMGDGMRQICESYEGAKEKKTSTIRKLEVMQMAHQIASALDGSHICLQRKPREDLYLAQYMCIHGFPNILLQAIVDSNNLFWSVVCSVAGGVHHDSTHFKECSLYTQLKRKEALGKPVIIQIQGEMIRPYIIAFSAYKARTFLVKPYCLRAGQILHEKRDFDRKLSKRRLKVENAFGLLKNRWRLLRELNVSPPFAPRVVVACLSTT